MARRALAERLLSPGEALFWLMGQAAPFNVVAALDLPLQAALQGLQASADLPFPVITTDRDGRPRWRLRAAGAPVRLTPPGSDWLAVGASMLQEALGTEATPGWSATVVPLASTATGAPQARVLVAAHHALTDARAMDWMLAQLLAGQAADRLGPALEESLAPGQFFRADAEALLDAWYSPGLAARWSALGPERLLAVLPPARPSVLEAAAVEVPLAQLRAACRIGQATPGALVAAVAAQQQPLQGPVSHAVDLSRVLRPAAAEGLGLTAGHALLPADGAPADGALWEQARSITEALQAQLASGRAADARLMLADALLGATPGVAEQRAVLGLTGYRPFASLEPNRTRPMPASFSAARAGGPVLHLLVLQERPLLLLSREAGLAPLDLPSIAEAMGRAVREALSS